MVEPTLTGLGGGGFLLARTAAGESQLFDFFVDTPGRGCSGPRLERATDLGASPSSPLKNPDRARRGNSTRGRGAKPET